jgi:Spy/CpxP family protein refolding chaperone
MIFHAARDLTLTPEQASALDQIDAMLHASDEGVRNALRSLEAHVVAGIRAGKLDPKTTRPDYAALDAAARDRADQQAAALGMLRGLLTPAQREELVLAVRARRAAHAIRPPDLPDDDTGDWTQRRLDQLSETLALDDAQKKKVAALLTKSALPRAQDIKARKDAEKARGDALLSAFQHDQFFDARSVDGGAIAARSSEDLIEGEDAFLGQLLTVLTPAQREKLAASREGRGSPGE